MATKKKEPVYNAESLLSQYMDFVLEHGTKPKTVFAFCKQLGIEERFFYQYYASFEAMEAAFFEALHEHTIALLQANEAYHTDSPSNQLLTYYFTFFEMAAANRSYILLRLGTGQQAIAGLVQLHGLRKRFLNLVQDIIPKQTQLPIASLQKVQAQFWQEAAWLQFMLTLQYWLHDRSPNFEKTDILIEKSVKASFDIMSTLPLQSVVDLGKFLWKERPFQ